MRQEAPTSPRRGESPEQTVQTFQILFLVRCGDVSSSARIQAFCFFSEVVIHERRSLQCQYCVGISAMNRQKSRHYLAQEIASASMDLSSHLIIPAKRVLETVWVGANSQASPPGSFIGLDSMFFPSNLYHIVFTVLLFLLSYSLPTAEFL